MANLRANRITSTEVFETTGSVQFDGVNGTNLQISNSTDIQLGSGTNWTIEFWALRPDAFVDYDVIIGKGNGSGTYEWFVEGFADGAVDILYSANGTTTWTGQHEILSSMNLNQWYHFALVRNGTSFKAYIDGIETFSTAGFNIYAGTGDLHIGGYGGAAAQDPPIFISNVRIVNGVSIYTENFTPPTRELEVIPNTVLLACQSTTKADEEKTGKTITVNGNAVANELTPGLLTSVVKSGGSSAITGSVEFDGSGDYLSVTPTDDFELGSDDFTIEAWVYSRNWKAAFANMIFSKGNSSSTSTEYYSLQATQTAGRVQFFWRSGSALLDGSNTRNLSTDSWNHVAVTRSGDTFSLYINGILDDTATSSTTLTTGVTGGVLIGGQSYDPTNNDRVLTGNISNLRVIKGTALYTSNFIPPTRKLTKLPGTVLLCCQDNESVTTEATGKTITANGDPTASNFTPSVGSDDSVEFAGPTTINTENYFYLPTGNTESRTGGAGGGDRGIFSGGHSPTNTIDFITISTTGNSQDFGDLTYTPFYGAACASSTRGLHAGGATPTIVNTINYLTIMTMGNAFDFGDLTRVSRDFNAFSSQTRGVFVGGTTPTEIDTIDFVTIATTSNAIDFGNLSGTRQQVSGSSSPTRGIIAGGFVSPAAVNTIEYVTIASTGDAVDFGDLATSTWALTAAASQTRSIIAGGAINPGGGTTATNTASYITIASTGNANDFGDLTVGRFQLTGVSNSTRGAFAGGYIPSPTSANQDTIDFVTIASTGNASDFGNLHGGARREMGGCSNGHGGLG